MVQSKKDGPVLHNTLPGCEVHWGYMAQTNAFCTVGLSYYPLLSRVSDKTIWQELLILTPESFGERNIPAVLQQLGSAGLTHRSAFLCGEFIERENAIFGDLPFYGFVAAIPVTLPDEFSTYTAKDGRQIIFAWMVPVTKAEAAIVRKEGWGKLEDMFVAQETDLVALDRSGII